MTNSPVSNIIPASAGEEDVEDISHLTDRPSDLRPQEVDLLVQPVKGKGAQSWIWFGEEPDDAGCRGEADHRARSL